MASLTDTLSEYTSEQGEPTTPNHPVSDMEVPLPDSESILEDSTPAATPNRDTCWSAMKVVWDRVRENCGTGISIKVGPGEINVPETIIHIASEQGSTTPATRDKLVETIMDTNWCKETAEQLYSQMSVFEHDSPSYFLGLANVERTIADAVVNKFRSR